MRRTRSKKDVVSQGCFKLACNSSGKSKKTELRFGHRLKPQKRGVLGEAGFIFDGEIVSANALLLTKHIQMICIFVDPAE